MWKTYDGTVRGKEPQMIDHRPDQILKAEQVAEILQVKTSTVAEWTRQGILPGFKVGRFWRYSRNSIEGHLAAKAAERVNPYR